MWHEKTPLPVPRRGQPSEGVCLRGAGPRMMVQTGDTGTSSHPFVPAEHRPAHSSLQDACTGGRRAGDIPAPCAPHESGATISGPQRRPGPTGHGQRARGSLVAQPPIRHPPPTPTTPDQPHFHHSGCRNAASVTRHSSHPRATGRWSLFPPAGHYSPCTFRAAFSTSPLVPERRCSSASTSSQ